MIKTFSYFFQSRLPDVAYHVTSEHRLSSIKRTGLIPRIGIFSRKIETKRGVYLFPDMDSVDNALMNWFGQEIEEWEQRSGKEFREVVLVIDTTKIKGQLSFSTGYQIVSSKPIDPKYITKVIKKY